MEAPDFSDEAIRRLLADMREDREAELEELADAAEPIPVPEELRARVLAKAMPLTAMLAAAEARADGVEINGYEASEGGDAAHYWMTPEELREYLHGEKAA